MKEDIVFANESLNKWCGTEGVNYYEGDTALGFLFKYAVPNLLAYYKKVKENDWFLTQEGKTGFSQRDLRDFLKRWIGELTGDYEKDTLALFWAICEIAEGEEMRLGVYNDRYDSPIKRPAIG